MRLPRGRGFGWAALLIGALAFYPKDAGALGLRIPNQDADAIARGNAFAATADNPSAVYYNPAGITQLDGEQVQFGVHALSVNSTYQSPAGAKYHSDFAVQPVPELYYTSSLGDSPLYFGLGVFSPYGVAMQWPDDVPFRTGGYYGSLTSITVNPVLAWRISDQLSVAAGPTFTYSQLLLRQGLGFVPNDMFQFRGDGSDFGFTAGIRWQPSDQWSFGAKYESATHIKFSGDSATSLFGNSASSASIPFPQFAAGGISFRPNTNWNVEADVDWTYWHSVGTVVFENIAVIGNYPLTFKWKSTYMFEAGATRYLEDGYYVSAGYFYSPNSTSQQYYNALIPDTNLHVGSAGFGHKGDHWTWMLAAQIITGPPHVVNNDVNPTVNGQYSWVNESLDFSIGYKF